MAVQASGDVLERVRDLMVEIRSLREEIAQPATDPSTGMATRKLPDDVSRELKNAVDEFRLFLWAYMDAWDGGREGPNVRLQKIRMQGAADMVALLAQEFRSGLPAGSEADRLRTAIDAIQPLFAR